MKVYVSDYDYEDLDIEREVLEPIGAEVIGLQLPTGEGLGDAAADADILMARYAKVTRQTIEKLTHCKAICRYGIGYDTVDVQAVYDHGMILTTIPDFCTDEVSESTISMAFSLLRQLPRYDRAVRRGSWKWQDAEVTIKRFQEATWGFIGFGKIAQNVRRKIAGFGFNVIAFDPFVSEATMMSHMVKKETIEKVFTESDIVAVMCPYTKDTHHVVDEQRLRSMKPSASLVNCSRGKLVDNEALYKALSNGWISGAGLDDLEDEPSKKINWDPSSNPLLSLPSCIFTPHSAYYSEKSMYLNRRMTAENARAVLLGERPVNIVKPEKQSADGGKE